MKDEQQTIAKNAAAVLKRNDDQPFFMSVGIFRPHVPMVVPQKWFDLYEHQEIKGSFAKGLPKDAASEVKPAGKPRKRRE